LSLYKALCHIPTTRDARDGFKMEDLPQNQAQGDSRVRLMIGFARHGPDLFSVTFGHMPVPACGQWIEGVTSRV
jgi:hypothetical protein